MPDNKRRTDQSETGFQFFAKDALTYVLLIFLLVLVSYQADSFRDLHGQLELLEAQQAEHQLWLDGLHDVKLEQAQEIDLLFEVVTHSLYYLAYCAYPENQWTEDCVEAGYNHHIEPGSMDWNTPIFSEAQ